MKFDPHTDKIAITIPAFTLHKHADGLLQKYSEPYMLSVAVDARGLALPRIDFNFMSFPNVRRGGTVSMLGDGHIVYGPKNPGEFVAVSVLIMEKDQDMVSLGKTIEAAVQSKAAGMGMRTVLASNPGAAVAVGALKELTQVVSRILKNNSDDELFRTEGSFLRDHAVPFHINRCYEMSNEFVTLNLQVLPLQQHNGQGPAPRSLGL